MRITNVIELLKTVMSSPQRITPFLQGPPGIGKSAIIHQIAKELGYVHFIDLRLSQHDSTDIKGIPNKTERETLSWLPPDFVPLKGSRWDDGQPGVWFFDEINRATVEVLQSVFEAVYDYSVGMNPIPDNWFVIAAGNYGYEDGTDVVEMDSALKDRFQIIGVDRPTIDEWKMWAIEAGVHPLVIEYLENHPDVLYCTSHHQEDKLLTPRTWDKFSQILKDNHGNESRVVSLMASTFLGSYAAPFIQFVNDNAGINAKDIFTRYDEVKDNLGSLDRQEVIGLIDKIDQYVRNTPITDLRGFNNFFFDFLTKDNQITLLTRLAKSNAGLTVLYKFDRKNPNLHETHPEVTSELEGILQNLVNDQG